MNLASLSGVDPGDLTPLQRMAMAALMAVEWVLRVLTAVVRFLGRFLSEVPVGTRATT